MIRGTTPTFTLTLCKDCDVDLNLAENVYFTISQGERTVTKTAEDGLNISDGNTVSVFLTQRESSPFADGKADVQLNWTYRDESGALRRAATKVTQIMIDKQLLGRVIE